MGFVYSCQKDLIEIDTQNQQSLPDKITVLNGRMYFPNREVLIETFQEYADASEDEIYDYMSRFYENDFLSLIPPITENNQALIIDQINKRIQKVLDKNHNKNAEDIYENLDDLEDIIGSEAYAAFLNSEAEIQVGDMIYKYTDVGLFFVKDDKYDVMQDFLTIRYISKDLLIPTDDEVKQSLDVEIPNAGETTLVNGVLYYFRNGGLHEIEPDDPEIIGGGSNNNLPTDPLSGLESFVQNLPICSGSSGFFGNLFGANKICIDYYDGGNRRVKTKAFNYNYYLVYHLGVKVKNQKKGFLGIWSKVNTSAVAMGVGLAQFEYDYTPIINAPLNNINQSNIKYARKQFNIQYSINSTIINYPSGNAPYVYSSSNTHNMSSYPQVFRDDLVIEGFGNSNIVDWAIQQANAQLTSEKLNEFFWNQVYNNAKTQLRSLTNNNSLELPKAITFVSNHPGYGKLLVQKTYTSSCTNCSIREKTFDFGGSGQIGIVFNPTNGSFNFSGGPGTMIPPKSFKVIMFGAAKRNGSWHGSKLHLGV